MVNPAFAIFMVSRLYAQGQKLDFVAAHSSVAPSPPQSWNLQRIQWEGTFFNTGVSVWVIGVIAKLTSGAGQGRE